MTAMKALRSLLQISLQGKKASQLTSLEVRVSAPSHVKVLPLRPTTDFKNDNFYEV